MSPPPMTRMVSPVTYAEASEARKTQASAMSSGRPSRRSGLSVRCPGAPGGACRGSGSWRGRRSSVAAEVTLTGAEGGKEGGGYLRMSLMLTTLHVRADPRRASELDWKPPPLTIKWRWPWKPPSLPFISQYQHEILNFRHRGHRILSQVASARTGETDSPGRQWAGRRDLDGGVGHIPLADAKAAERGVLYETHRVRSSQRWCRQRRSHGDAVESFMLAGLPVAAASG